MKVTVKLEGADELAARLRKLGADARGDSLRAAALDGARVLRDAANAGAPGPHIEVDAVEVSANRAVVEIGPDEEHWHYKFFETGTQPHSIRPATRKKLKFEVSGEEVFALGVRHPGMAAQPFLRPALDEKKDRATDAAGKTLRRKLGI